MSPGVAKLKVSELFSPPRVVSEIAGLPELGLAPGSTFDLRSDSEGNSWDFLRAGDRDRARLQIQKDKPFLIIGSLPCIFLFSTDDIEQTQNGSENIQAEVG